MLLNSVIEIETARLRMRPATLGDIDALHRLWTDPGVRRYLWDDVIISREQAAEVVTSSLETFATHGFGQWVVMPKEEDEVIGFCGFRFFGEEPEVEILYGLASSHWGQGLATEAAQAMLRCGFEEHGFERIWAGADPPNAASFRIMEKTGMSFIKRTRVNGLEAIYYAIARAEFHPGDEVYIVRRAALDQ
jgi:ribosomal-protein-alanine N-acetyltransferase